MRSYQLRETTADTGLLAEADSFSELVSACLDGLYETACGGVPQRDCSGAVVSGCVNGEDESELLFSVMNDALFLLFTRRQLLCNISCGKKEISYSIIRYDGVFSIEVKAVTKHQFSVRHENGVWRAAVIFDI